MDITNKIDAVTKIGEDRVSMGGIQAPPKSVKIELTGRCNLRCKFCAVGTRSTQPVNDMDLWLFKKITEDMRLSGVEEIGLFYLGESFCNTGLLLDALKWCKEDLKFPWVFLTSNATLAKPIVVSELLRSGLDSLKWSVNFNSPEQFEEITGGSAELFLIAAANIKAAWELKQKTGSKTLLSASSILYEGEQQDKMKAFLDEHIKPYVDKHYWLPLYQMSMYKDKIQKELGYTPTAGNCGRIDESTMEATRVPLPCWCAFTEGHVRHNGGLSACGFGADARFDMGLLDGTNFMRQWNSKKFIALREAQLRTLTEGQKALKGTPCNVCVAFE